jgi:hypothetical protein
VTLPVLAGDLGDAIASDVAYNLIYGSNYYRNFCGKQLFRPNHPENSLARPVKGISVTSTDLK